MESASGAAAAPDAAAAVAAADDDASSVGVPASSAAESLEDEARDVLDELGLADDVRHDRVDAGEADRRHAVAADRERKMQLLAAEVAAVEAARQAGGGVAKASATAVEAPVGGDAATGAFVHVDELRGARPAAGVCAVCELDGDGVAPCRRCGRVAHADCGHGGGFCSRFCAQRPLLDC